jgi:hypothetical protein
MARQAAHEDDAASVEANHGGQELSQAPHLAHQVYLPSINVIILAYRLQKMMNARGIKNKLFKRSDKEEIIWLRKKQWKG